MDGIEFGSSVGSPLLFLSRQRLSVTERKRHRRERGREVFFDFVIPLCDDVTLLSPLADGWRRQARRASPTTIGRHLPTALVSACRLSLLRFNRFPTTTTAKIYTVVVNRKVVPIRCLLMREKTLVTNQAPLTGSSWGARGRKKHDSIYIEKMNRKIKRILQREEGRVEMCFYWKSQSRWISEAKNTGKKRKKRERERQSTMMTCWFPPSYSIVLIASRRRRRAWLCVCEFMCVCVSVVVIWTSRLIIFVHPIFVCFSFLVKADDIEFNAQVPAAISSGARQRHPQAALQHVSHLCLQGDRVHRRHGLSKWKGVYVFD